MKPNVIIFGTENFNKSLNEVKDYFDLSFNFVNKNLDVKKISDNSIVLIDSDIFEISEKKEEIKKLNDKNILLIEHSKLNSKLNYNEKLTCPFDLSELNKKITLMISSLKFNKNSSVNIKEYILDKNEKKLKKGMNFVVLTEREIQLLELLHNQKKSLSKSFILKEVWKYSDEADTHTVETHVYRLRKKIKEKFLDDNLIINNNEGYSI